MDIPLGAYVPTFWFSPMSPGDGEPEIETLTTSPARTIEANHLQQSRLTPLWNVPQCNPFFTGRDAYLNRIREALLRGSNESISQPLAISGLGGIGKTQTA